MALVCKWDKPVCRRTFPTAEELFNHLCDGHVGRKRHGNLSLNCSWEACDHKAAKRDHMTSHMMVHCPLQTNVCGICSKTFKRSYDLRKHEITHTAAHHQAHGRSRATVYQDVDISLGVSALDRSTPVNHSRVYSCPREHSVDSLSAAKLAAPGAARRGSSVPGAKAKPYLRPGSSTPFAGHSSREFFRHEPAQFPAGGYEQIGWSARGGAVSRQKSAGAYGGGTVYGSAYGGSAALDCQPLVYPPSCSFSPYRSFAGLVDPYPLLAEQPPGLGEFRSFSTPPAEQQAYQHATNFAPSAAGAGQQQLYIETDGYGQPAWQTGLHASASEPSVLFPASSDAAGAGPLGWPSSTRSAMADCDPLGLNHILSEIRLLIDDDDRLGPAFVDYTAFGPLDHLYLDSHLFSSPSQNPV